MSSLRSNEVVELNSLLTLATRPVHTPSGDPADPPDSPDSVDAANLADPVGAAISHADAHRQVDSEHLDEALRRPSSTDRGQSSTDHGTEIDSRPVSPSGAGSGLMDLPDSILHRICFFLDVPAARQLALTCSTLRDIAEGRVWESVDVCRVAKKRAFWSTRQCYDYTRRLILAHPIRANLIKNISLSWQLCSQFNKRDPLILSHPAQIIPLELNASAVPGPAEEWRSVLNRFPTLPACQSINLVVHDILGLETIIYRFLRIAPNCSKIAIHLRAWDIKHRNA